MGASERVAVGGIMSTFRSGTAAESPAARRIQDQKPHAQRIPEHQKHNHEYTSGPFHRFSPLEGPFLQRHPPTGKRESRRKPVMFWAIVLVVALKGVDRKSDEGFSGGTFPSLKRRGIAPDSNSFTRSDAPWGCPYWTVVGTTAVLFVRFGSNSVAVTVAKLVNVPRTLGKAVMVIVAVTPRPRVPS